MSIIDDLDCMCVVCDIYIYIVKSIMNNLDYTYYISKNSCVTYYMSSIIDIIYYIMSIMDDL